MSLYKPPQISTSVQYSILQAPHKRSRPVVYHTSSTPSPTNNHALQSLLTQPTTPALKPPAPATYNPSIRPLRRSPQRRPPHALLAPEPQFTTPALLLRDEIVVDFQQLLGLHAEAG